MEPKNFKEATSVLTAPGSMPNCGDLPVYKDGRQCVSCWHVSMKERFAILFTGSAWMGVKGVTQPPVWLSGRCPFTRPNIFDRIRGLLADLADVVRDMVHLAVALKNEQDKRKHVVAGLAISLVAGVVFGPWWGLVAGVIAGMLKEAWDRITRKGTPEWFDFITTVLGAVFGFLIAGFLYVIVM